MMPIAPLLVCSTLVLNAAATVPTYNVKPTCRAAIQMSALAGRTVEMREASEAQARAEIVKAWSTFPDLAKERCIRTGAGHHAPSYIELVICLESVRDQQKRQGLEKKRQQAVRDLAKKWQNKNPDRCLHHSAAGGGAGKDGSEHRRYRCGNPNRRSVADRTTDRVAVGPAPVVGRPESRAQIRGVRKQRGWRLSAP